MPYDKFPEYQERKQDNVDETCKLSDLLVLNEHCQPICGPAPALSAEQLMANSTSLSDSSSISTLRVVHVIKDILLMSRYRPT